jgi:glycosyltransferase domain-containing protein
MMPRLTVVLPLKGRPLFTLRFLWFANQGKVPYRILIADGQVDPAFARVLENSRDVFPNLDVEYIRYPDDVDFQHFYAKMADVLQRVRTPYAMLADNDDFLVRSGIDSSIDFLEANPDYACCGGGVSGFSIYGPKAGPLAGLVGPLNRIAFRYAPADKSIDIGSPSMTDRLFRGLRISWGYYAVFRSAGLATVHRDAVELNLSDLQLHERFCAMRILTLGKARSNPSTISYLRQYGTSMRAAFSKDWVHHLVRSRFSSDFAHIIDRISRLAAEADGKDQNVVAEELRTRIESWFRKFLRLNYGFSGSMRGHLRNRAPSLVAWLKRRRRYSLPLERKAIFTKLSQNGSSKTYLETFRTELSEIENTLCGNEFRNFVEPFIRKLAIDPSVGHTA